MKHKFKYFGLLLLVLLLISCNNTVNNETNNSVNAVIEEVIEAPVVEAEEVTVTLNVLGRSSMRLDFSDGNVVYIDPATGSVDDYALAADLVLVTHQHSDHNVVERVTLKDDGEIIQCPMDIRSGQSIDVKGLEITAVDAYNENHDILTSCGLIIKFNDIVIYHSGDTSKTDTMGTFEKYNIDYALLCMDGYYNMDTEEAMKVADLIKAQAVIPMHTSSGGSYDEKIAEAFVHNSKIDVKPGESLILKDLHKVDVVFEEAIEKIMSDRLEAIVTKNYDLYMTAITKINPYFFNEQERWFMGMTDELISDVSFVIESTEMIDEYTAVANIKQQHTMDKTYDLNYPLLFKFENGQWQDYGYHFEIYETERFTVKYMKGETRVEEFAKMLDDAFDNLDPLYAEKPHPYFELKLFSDQELLRQRTIPANGWLFTGWSEPDESLKLFTGHQLEYQGYPGVMQHEVVHHITIRICNNNLAVWLLEGIAMYDGSAHYGFENSSLLSNMSKRGVKMSLKGIEKMDMTSDLTREEILNFYTASYMYVRYIDETYGRETLMNLFYEAGKKPFHDSTLNDTFESNNQISTGEVIESVLGITKDELSSAYLTWLKTVDFIE